MLGVSSSYCITAYLVPETVAIGTTSAQYVSTAIANSLQGRLILGTQGSFAIISRNKIESQSLERGNIFKGLSTWPFNYREVSEIVHSIYSGNKAIGT